MYEIMKDSGIEWLGKIPQHWKQCKLSYCFYLIGSGTTPKSDNEDYYNGDIPWLQSGDIYGSTVTETSKRVTSIALNETPSLRIYKAPFIAIAMYGASIANISVVTIDSCTNQACCVLSKPSDDIDAGYVFFVLNAAKKQLLLSSRGGTQPNISQDIIKKLVIPTPPINEQKTISNYLKFATQNLNKAIAEAKASIEDYKLLKQSIITQAVTKGLNPTVPMKDSGIEWIGEIPEHWEIARIKYNYYLKGRIGWQGLKSDEFIDEGPYLITGTDFDNGSINWNKCYHISEYRYNEAPEIHVKERDLLVTKDGTVGKVAYITQLPGPSSLNSHLLLIRSTNPNYDNRFLYWIIKSSIFEKYTGLSQNGSIMASLSQEKISNFSYPIPSIEEQALIYNFLDAKCSEIDTLIKEKESMITDLEAYKKSLIFEVVTGKRKVC